MLQNDFQLTILAYLELNSKMIVGYSITLLGFAANEGIITNVLVMHLYLRMYMLGGKKFLEAKFLVTLFL